jgi:hypothetical protein
MQLSRVKETLKGNLEKEYGDTWETQARKITAIINERPDGYNAIDTKLDKINDILCGYGVEDIRGPWVNNYFCDINLLYVNMGDTYIPTIIYDTLKERWYCCSWGDIVETQEKRFTN